MSAVMMPTSISLGRATIRPRMSAATRRAAPVSAENGSSQRLSIPINNRHRLRDDQTDEADRSGNGSGCTAEQHCTERCHCTNHRDTLTET